MNTFKDVWKQFKLFIRFDSETILKISQDRYETGNAFLVVTISLLALYAPIFLNSNLSNIFDLIFFGVLDGTFSWVFSSLVMWFALGRIFKENIDLNAVVTITGYSHGLIGFVALWYVIQSSLMNFGERINQVFILLIIFWIYMTVSKSLELGFFIEKRNTRVASAIFIFILFWTSDPLKIII